MAVSSPLGDTLTTPYSPQLLSAPSEANLDQLDTAFSADEGYGEPRNAALRWLTPRAAVDRRVAGPQIAWLPIRSKLVESRLGNLGCLRADRRCLIHAYRRQPKTSIGDQTDGDGRAGSATPLLWASDFRTQKRLRPEEAPGSWRWLSLGEPLTTPYCRLRWGSDLFGFRTNAAAGRRDVEVGF